MRIVDLTPENSRATEQVARLLIEGFRDTGSEAWADLEDARTEVIESFQPEFYQKVGFEIVGIIPDANGFGKPDILMAKRIQRRQE